MACPLPTDPAFQALVATYGIAQAHTAHTLNGGEESPSVASARVLLAGLIPLDADEREVRRSERGKLARNHAQVDEQLRPFLTSPHSTEAQKQNIQLIIDNALAYRAILESNVEKFDAGINIEKTTSVTTYIGSSDYTGKTVTFEGFKFFGTYVHQLLEDLQVLSNKNQKTPAELLTRAYFDAHRSAMAEDDKFTIEGLGETELYEMAHGVASLLQRDAKSRSIILPEITFMGTNRYGQRVVGRLDLMVMDPDGRVKVVDFKTKKVTDLVDAGGQIDPDKARQKLARESWAISSSVLGTAKEFATAKRTTFDTWTLQTKIYENMLLQAGLQVAGSDILALMYQADPLPAGGQKFVGHVVEVFTGNNYYTSAGTGAKDGLGRPLTEAGTEAQVAKLRAHVDFLMPITAEQQATSQRNLVRDFAFDLDEAGEKRLLAQMQNMINAELPQVLQQIKLHKARKNATQLAIYEARKVTLDNFQATLTSGGNVASSYKMLFTTQALDAEFKTLLGITQLAHADFHALTGEQKLAAGAVLQSAHARLVELGPLFKIVYGLVNQAVNDVGTPGITATSGIVTLMGDLRAAEDTIVQALRERGFFATKNNIQEMIGSRGHAQMSEAMGQRLDGLISLKELEISQIRADLPVTFNSRLAKGLWLLKDKVAKTLLTQDLDAIAKAKVIRLEKAEQELLQLQQQRQVGFSSSDEELKRYIEGITDTESTDYIGQSDRWNNMVKNLGGFQATIANSDRGIYAFTAKLKQAANDALQTTQANFQARKLDHAIRDSVAQLGEAGANKSVTESRSVTRTRKNPETGLYEESTSTQQYFKKPTSSAYDQFILSHNDATQQLSDEIKQAEAAVYSVATEAERVPLRAAYEAKVAEKAAAVKAFAQWQQLHQHRPMVARYYELENRLPPAIQAKVASLFSEIEVLTLSNGGRNNEETFSPDTLELIHRLEEDIKRVRIEANALVDGDEYARIIDDLKLFFDYEPNLEAYNRVKQAKERQYIDTPEELVKWHAENTVYAPTPAYFADKDRLFKRIVELKGEQHPELQRLYAERGRIRGPFKRDGEFDPTHLSDADRQGLNDIEFALSTFEHADQALSDEDQAELKKLFAELKSMSTSEQNPFYLRKLNADTDTLLEKYRAWQQAQVDAIKAKSTGDDALIQAARANENRVELLFLNYQQGYETWFNQNHTKPFNPKPVPGSKRVQLKFQDHGLDPRDKAMPKGFNYDSVPAEMLRAQYMEHRPRGKWNRRITLDAAINPDYEQHFRLPDGTALPKSLRIDDGVVSVIRQDALGQPVDQQYVNPAYTGMLQNPLDKALYNSLLPYYFERQDSITARKPGYRVPGGSGNLFQESANHAGGVVGALQNRKKNYLDETFGGKGSENDALTNVYGANKNIRLRGNNQLSENLQGGDSINNLVKWLAESHYNEAMADTQPELQSIIDYWSLQLKDITEKDTGSNLVYKQRAGELTKLIGLAQYELDKFVTGKASNGDNLAARKIIGQLAGATAFARIAFDGANQVKNYVSGSLQSFMAAGNDKSSAYKREDSAWAYTQQFGSGGYFADYIRDWGRLSDLSLNTQLYRAYDPGQHGIEKVLEDTTAGKSRRFKAKALDVMELAHAAQEKGDMLVAQNVWLAIMHHHQYRVLDAQGEPVVESVRADGTKVYQLVRAHEVYALDSENRLVIRPDVEFTKEDERWLRETVHSEVRKAQGNYAAADKTLNESTVFGQIMSFFRKYLIPNVLTRLGHARPNWEGKELHYGYLRATIAAVKIYGFGETAKHLLVGAYTPNWVKGSQMSTLYSGKVAHTGRDLISASILSAISFLLLGYVKQKDADKEEIGFWVGNLIRVIWGVKQETVSMNPFPIVGGADDYIKNFTSFTTMTTELARIPKVLMHLLGMSYASLVGGWGEEPEEDDFLYQMAYSQAYYAREQGPYEAGDFKLDKDIADFSGWKNIRNFAHPAYALDNLKKFQ